MAEQILPSDVVAFWKEAGPDKWYSKDKAFDTDFRVRFKTPHWAAARGEHADWIETPDGALALAILLDQYPRNSFRNSAHQFATDGLARAVAREAIKRDYLKAFGPDLRQFLLMPLMHSEDIKDQDDLLPLCAKMPETLKYAKIYRDIIARFGRFPHRNAALGRETTAEEQAFLDDGGFKG